MKDKSESEYVLGIETTHDRPIRQLTLLLESYFETVLKQFDMAM